MKRRMHVPPGYWTFAAAVSAVNVTLDLHWWTQPSWVPGWSSWPAGGWWLLADVTLTCTFTVLAVRSLRSASRRESRRLVRELVAAVKPLRGGTWLNRDEHLIFQVRRRARIWMVVRVPEEAAHAAAGSIDQGPAPLMFESFQWWSAAPVVYRDDDMALVTVDGDDVVPVKLPAGRGRIRRLGRTMRPSGTLGTSGPAPDAMVRDLIRQLRAAERMDDR